MLYSLNPYQGCEHGCIYCYARNTHPFWGFSAGLDFEQKIIIKPEAAALLERTLQKPSWKGYPISISGNTDCYQPVERQMRITRRCIEVMYNYRNAMSIITKNKLILRDLDLLSDMAKQNLVHVMITITTLNEDLRQKMEPRAPTAASRLQAIDKLSKAGVPVGVMIAPVIPGLNAREIPDIIRQAAECGANEAGYTILRLNKDVELLFTDWIQKTFPSSASKVLNQVADCHGGKVGDSRFVKRMRGEGPISSVINQLFRTAIHKYMPRRGMPPFDLELFRRVSSQGQLTMF
jgi:DNA repair photolyase